MRDPGLRATMTKGELEKEKMERDIYTYLRIFAMKLLILSAHQSFILSLHYKVINLIKTFVTSEAEQQHSALINL